MTDSCIDDDRWNRFVPDAAAAIDARGAFEAAVADSLEHPFDVTSQGRMSDALQGLRVATPAARRLVALNPGEFS